MGRTWSDAELDAFRQQADPPADEVVASLAAQHAFDEVDKDWQVMRHSDDPVPPGLPPELEAFLKAPAPVLEHADRQRIARGERFFADRGPQIVTALLCASLPTAYSCARGAEVLGRTGRMQGDLRLRIDETAQLVFDVAAPGGMTRGGRGECTLHKVRLVHAAVRFWVLRDGWDAPRNGLPINQEDLAGTLLSFGYVTARAVEQLGGTVRAEEWDAWLYLWSLAGQLLGIDERLVPRDRDEADTLMRAILRRQQAPSANGRDLASALVTHIDSYIPGRFWDGITAELMRHFIGDRAADWLGVPRHNWTGALLWLEREWASRVRSTPEPSRLLRRAEERFHVALLEAMAAVDRRGKPVRFRIPDTLRPRPQG